MIFDLNSLLIGQDSGGIWKSGTCSSPDNAFVITGSNVTIPSTTIEGTYKFNYSFLSTDTCSGDCITVDLIISKVPTLLEDKEVTLMFETVNLYSLANINNTAGIWTTTSSINISNPNQVTFNQEGSFDFKYTLTNTCGSDELNLKVNIVSCPKSGTRVNRTICNEVINLFDSLVDYTIGGTWNTISLCGDTSNNPDVINLSTPTSVDFTNKLDGIYKFYYSVTKSGCNTECTEVTITKADCCDISINSVVIDSNCPSRLIINFTTNVVNSDYLVFLIKEGNVVKYSKILDTMLKMQGNHTLTVENIPCTKFGQTWTLSICCVNDNM